jgi:hypothetical protein
MTDSYAQFGQKLLEVLQSAPFGSLTKRELELGLLQVGIETGLLSKEPATLAATLQLTLTKTNSYLTDLALR